MYVRRIYVRGCLIELSEKQLLIDFICFQQVNALEITPDKELLAAAGLQD